MKKEISKKWFKWLLGLSSIPLIGMILLFFELFDPDVHQTVFVISVPLFITLVLVAIVIRYSRKSDVKFEQIREVEIDTARKNMKQASGIFPILLIVTCILSYFLFKNSMTTSMYIRMSMHVLFSCFIATTIGAGVYLKITRTIYANLKGPKCNAMGTVNEPKNPITKDFIGFGCLINNLGNNETAFFEFLEKELHPQRYFLSGNKSVMCVYSSSDFVGSVNRLYAILTYCANHCEIGHKIQIHIMHECSISDDEHLFNKVK